MRRLLFVVLASLGLLLAPLSAVSASAGAHEAAKPNDTTAVAAAKKTKLRAQIPRGARKLGARAPIKGMVTGPRRPVLVQVKTNRGFVTVARTRTNKNKRFQVKAPTWWIANQKIRVFAPRKGKFKAAKSLTRQLKIKRGYKPRGGKAHAYLVDRTTRWNPCRVITYRINPARSGKRGVRDVRIGMKRLQNATGLRFRYLGKTKELPLRNGKVRFRSDMVIGFATPKQVPQLRGSVIGVGGFTSGNTGRGFGITSGFVTFDSKAPLRPGYGKGRPTWGKVILHELAHAVGLSHVNDRRLLMYPAVLPAGPSRYGKGDLIGLRSMGLNRGCLPKGGNRAEPRTVMQPTTLG